MGCDLPSAKATHLALELRAVADAHDVEIFLEAGGDAGDRVGDQSASQTVQRAMIFGGAQGVQHAVLLLEGDAVRERRRSACPSALALRLDRLCSAIFTPLGSGIGLLPIRDICCSSSLANLFHLPGATRPRHYKSLKLPTRPRTRISPPILALRAERPLIRPFGVVRMLMPSPPTTGRMSAAPR